MIMLVNSYVHTKHFSNLLVQTLVVLPFLPDEDILHPRSAAHLPLVDTVHSAASGPGELEVHAQIVSLLVRDVAEDLVDSLRGQHDILNFNFH